MLGFVLPTQAHAEPKKTKLDYNDFWSVAGVTRDSTPESVMKLWGDKATQSTMVGEPEVSYAQGPDVGWRKDGAIQINLSEYHTDYIANGGLRPAAETARSRVARRGV